MNDNKKRREFNKILFRWHKTHYRDMPWRRTCDPYSILVSEIMLQQTQVDRVRAKYVEFLKKFPDVDALAHAPLCDVLRVWSGLGYNLRARYLRECAEKVINEYDGKFPNDLERLKKLPGIGLSTAGALLAFAHGEGVPVIDTNIRRILVRTFFKRNIPSDKKLLCFAKSLVPMERGREWNYAMLDLGATLCTARGHSPKCPLTKLHGKVGDFQYKKPQKKFAGSRRFYRGQVLKLLIEQKVLTLAQLTGALKLSILATHEILESLGRDRLIIFSRGRIVLPK